MAARNPGLCQLLLVCVVAVAISGAIGVAGVIIEGSVSVSELYRDATVVVVGGEEEEEAKMSSGITGGIDAGEQLGKVWTLEEIYEELQECPIVKTLNSQASSSDSGKSGPVDTPFTHTLFSYLFPLGPAGNALLATAYISGPPNFLLALVPPDIDPSRLSIMVAFAIGGLLGDTLLHLIPGSFLGGEDEGGSGHGVEFVIKNDQRNLLIGGMIMVGFVVFVAMDKALRVAGMGTAAGGHDGGGHGHSSHSTAHSHSQGTGTGADGTVMNPPGEIRKRKGGKGDGATTKGADEQQEDEEAKEKQQVQEVKMSSYLNIIADFSHNITDGLAMSAAFYASPLIGATTTIGVFFHEIPHEVGDFALLVQSGFTKWQAMGAQFVTAVGAFIGTLIGIAIQHFSAHDRGGGGGGATPWNGGIWSTGLAPGDLVLPFTAGTFLYVGFSAVPELLQVDETRSRSQEVRRSLCQLVAMAAGFAIMVFVS